jgi:hypothetical protein
MAVSEVLEDLVSHLPALQLLHTIGYQYLTPTEALKGFTGVRRCLLFHGMEFVRSRVGIVHGGDVVSY